MKTVITQQEIADADLRPYKEIWLTSKLALTESGHTEGELCLWRAEEAFTHDMMSEGTHDQNLKRIWLSVDDLDDQKQVLEIENRVRQRLVEQDLNGEFYPAEVGEGHACEG